MRIAFIGFGEAGRAFADSLRAEGNHALSAFDRKDTREMAEAMAARGVRQGAGPGEAVEGAEWIVSAVTADQSLAAGRSVLTYLAQGQVFLDINSVSPDRKGATATEIEATGAHYVDMAVMAPVHPGGHATPVLIAGGTAAALAPALTGAGFTLDVVGPKAGEATAVKMVRSLFVKGLEAITVEALLAASASGCFERVLASLSKSYPGLGWPENARYNFERTLKHGARRSAEMRESAATLGALGLNGALAAEVAAVQERMGALDFDDLPGGDLETAVAALARARTGR